MLIKKLAFQKQDPEMNAEMDKIMKELKDADYRDGLGGDSWVDRTYGGMENNPDFDEAARTAAREAALIAIRVTVPAA